MYKSLANGEPVDNDGRFLHNAMSIAGELQTFIKHNDDILELSSQIMALKGLEQQSESTIGVPKDYLKPQDRANLQPTGEAIAPAILAAYCVIVLLIGKLEGWSAR